jgi:hypothetical protein
MGAAWIGRGGGASERREVAIGREDVGASKGAARKQELEKEVEERIATEAAVILAQRRASGAFLERDVGMVREAAAETLTLAGDRRKAAGDAAAAAAAYATVARLFPETTWGERAAGRAE